MAICCPQIYEDRQDGFMMQFASAGQWGRGLYFAEEAGYSDIYASKAKHMQPDVRDTKGLAMDESEFMLASLLVGSVVELDRDLDGAMQKACNALKTPPAVDGCNTRPLADGEPACTRPPQQAKGRKYNTVRGYTQTCSAATREGGGAPRRGLHASISSVTAAPEGAGQRTPPPVAIFRFGTRSFVFRFFLDSTSPATDDPRATSAS